MSIALVLWDGALWDLPLFGAHYVRNLIAHLAVEAEVSTNSDLTTGTVGVRGYLLATELTPYAAIRVGVSRLSCDDCRNTFGVAVPALGLEVASRGGFTASLEVQTLLLFARHPFPNLWVIPVSFGYRF